MTIILANGDATQSQEQEIKSDTQFFERINAQAKEVINKEHRNEKINKTEAKKFQKQFNDETITIAQIQVKIDQLFCLVVLKYIIWNLRHINFYFSKI